MNPASDDGVFLAGERQMPRTIASERVSQRAFVGVSTLLFVVSTAVTIVWSTSMSEMDEMPMPGGWTMSMAWMRMPGQTWVGAAASFVGMWVVMMMAMMLPSLVPMLSRYRQAIGKAAGARVGWLTAVAGIGYFLAWTVYGIVAFPLGAALTTFSMQQPALARAVPIAVGVVVLVAGALQCTAWKAHQLACCRRAIVLDRMLQATAGSALRHGLRLGIGCIRCCGALMAALLVIGVMDVPVMAVVAAAITVERLAPAAESAARGVGVVAVAAGVFLIVRAVS
jgi:predicted metal-binding membrane protein